MSDISTWLEGHGLGKYVEAFVDNEIELADIIDLTDDDLRELGLPMGPRKRLLRAAAARAATDGDDGAGAGSSSGKSSSDATTDRSMVAADAERRQLTVMFADVVNWTVLARRLEMEDLREVNLAYQRVATSAIEQFEGYVARYMGDGVLAYFGFPQAHEDDAERAVRAGLALVEAVNGLDVGALVDGEERLAVRVGIATGPVVIGDLIGEGPAQEWAVMGDTPNLAARVEGMAAVNTVAVAPGTHRLTDRLFAYESMGEHRLKGIDEAVELWWARAALEVPSRFRATRARRSSPLMGRDEELALLERRWQAAVTGEGHVVMLCGEAGIGKSRLAEALREAARATPHAWIAFQCSPHHTNSPFHPFITQFSHAAEIGRATDDLDRLARLKQLFERSGSTDSESIEALCGLFPFGPARGASGTSQERKALIIEAILGQLRGLSRQGPVLCLFEDIHWADPSTLEVLDHIVGQVGSQSTLLLITFREHHSPPWSGQAATTVLTLNRMGLRDSERLVSALGARHSLSSDAIHEIAKRADGIPLFLEELAESAGEQSRDDRLSGASTALSSSKSQGRVDLPSSLRDALMARLDRSPLVRDIAQVASVIGRDFEYRLLESIVNVDADELSTGLQELVSTGLIQVRGDLPEATCRFKHALIRDAAYDSLVRDRLRDLHRRVATGLEGTADAALLAFHFEKAGMIAQAVACLHKAGDRASSSFALAEAREHYHHAMALLDETGLQDASAKRLRIELTLEWAKCSFFAVTPVLVGEVQQARDLAATLDDDPLAARVLYWLGRMLQGLGRYKDSLTVFDECSDITRTIGDERLHALVGSNAARSRLHNRGDFSKARELMIEHLPILDRDGEHDEAIMSRGMLAWVCAWQGGFEEGFNWGKEALALATTARNRTREANAWLHISYAHSARGDWDDVIEHAERGLDLARPTGNKDLLVMAQGSAGHAAFMNGERVRGLQLLREALSESGRTRKEFVSSVRLAFCLAESGEWDEAIAIANRVVADEQYVRSRPEALLALAIAQDSRPDADRAAASSAFAEAIELSNRYRMRPFTATVQFYHARSLLGHGDDEAGRAELERASAAFVSMGMDWWAREAQALAVS